MPIGLYIYGMDTLNVSDQTDYIQYPFNIQQRGLRHCLSSGDGQYQSLIRGMSDGLRFPRFFMRHCFIFGLGIAGQDQTFGPRRLRPTREQGRERQMSPLKTLSDSELIAKLLANDEKAVLYFFYEKFYSTFEYHVYRIFPYEVDVQGLVHEFFLYLCEDNWRRLRTYKPDMAQLNTWISAVSFRFFLNFKKSKIDSNGLVTIYEQWDDKIMQYKQECHNQIRMDVAKAIECLKNTTEQEVARELLLEDADIKDVAESHQLSVDYAYTVKSRAMAHLRKLLKDYRS